MREGLVMNREWRMEHGQVAKQRVARSGGGVAEIAYERKANSLAPKGYQMAPQYFRRGISHLSPLE
jgi:hypothetical protein